VDLASGVGRVVYRPAQTGIADIEDAIRRAGFHPRVISNLPLESGNAKEATPTPK
jgi:hypothetical protein